jgi:hypothetical protein
MQLHQEGGISVARYTGINGIPRYVKRRYGIPQAREIPRYFPPFIHLLSSSIIISFGENKKLYLRCDVNLLQ